MGTFSSVSRDGPCRQSKEQPPNLVRRAGMGSDGIETSIEALAARVQVLERDVGVMKGILWHSAGAAPDSPPPAAPQPAPPQPVAPNGWAPPSAPSWGPARAPAWAPAAPGPAAPSLALRDEAKLAGAWFARAGALAVLVGAGFAFKYGIDRGLITEPVRVLVGLLAGLAFVAWGYWARRKGWATFSQAVTAGGIAICYLSVTVANLAYHLISGPVTFGSLVAITAGSAALAYWYDSLALAILATVGGFLTPFLAWQGGKPQGAALYTYVAILDAGVLGLAFFKAWRPLDAVARAGTSILLGVGLSSVGFGVAMGFATAFLLLFVAVPVLANLAPARRDGETSDEADGVLLVASTLAYYGFGMFLLWHHDHADLRGAFTFGLAGAFAGLASLAAVVAPRDRMLRLFLWALSVAAITTAIPLQFHQFAVALGWAGEGLGLTWAGMRARSVTLRTVGAAIPGVGHCARRDCRAGVRGLPLLPRRGPRVEAALVPVERRRRQRAGRGLVERRGAGLLPPGPGRPPVAAAAVHAVGDLGHLRRDPAGRGRGQPAALGETGGAWSVHSDRRQDAGDRPVDPQHRRAGAGLHRPRGPAAGLLPRVPPLQAPDPR